MEPAALELRLARLRRAIERAASDAPSEARQTALESLAHFAVDLAGHFEAQAPGSPRRAAEARLRGDLCALEERARAAGDWPETWRSVQREFERFAAALQQYERARPGSGES